MAQVLTHLPPTPPNANVLIGFDTVDDAGVYRLDASTALIQTLDFFTPIVDDPYWYGQIAAANSLSDVYAMGGRPLTAMNIVCFPCSLDLEILGEIIRGGAEKVAESGAVLLGGHTVQDDEPKYGLSVTGIVHPGKIWANVGAQAGDALVLTKPIGTGVISTALKKGIPGDDVITTLTRSMATLNKVAAEAASALTIHACTDVTGFGLLGHLAEMAEGSQVTARILASQVLLLPGAYEYAQAGMLPGGLFTNLTYLEPKLEVITGVDPDLVYLLADPQTSGGLLFALPTEEASDLVAACREQGVQAAAIGEFTQQGSRILVVEP